jgi:hypothetical protein
MVMTLEKISNEIFNSYTHTLSEKDRINSLLDHILDKKQEYINLSNGLVTLNKLLSQLTWINDLTESDEVIIRGLLDLGKKVDFLFRKFYASERRNYSQKGWFKDEFFELKSSIELHQEALFDVEHIIFELRKDKEFNELTKLLDNL